ncbi:MAG: sirohydrochlorin chelatase [Ktedonobacteraceae bacterium]
MQGASKQAMDSASEAIVIMGHGSRDSEGSQEFLTFATRLASRLGRPVYPGFLELADPPIVAAIDEAIQAGAQRIIAIPWMLLGAGHVKNDLPAAIQIARQRYPQVTIRYGTPITIQPELLSVLGDRLAAIDPDKGMGSPKTALLLVQRGSSDPEANAEVYRAARLLWEGRNFAAVEVAFSGITRPDIQEGLQRCLSYAAVRLVLVLPYFLYTGVLVKRIPRITEDIAAAHPEHEFHVAAHMGQDVQLEALAQRMIEQVQSGNASMSCDLCQYRVPLFGREALVGAPQISDHAHGLRGTGKGELTHSHRGYAHSTQDATTATLASHPSPAQQESASKEPPSPQTPALANAKRAISAAPMASAPMQYSAEGLVAWDQMWSDFCDLALAGGPPHRGTLLEPILPAQANSNPAAYERVVAEIERGLRLVTVLSTVRATTPGWVGLQCADEAMALWLLQAIVAENVCVRREGATLFLPAGPDFQLEKEIKNVITSVAKTYHYWTEHRFHNVAST